MMTLVKHELKQGFLSFVIWFVSIAFMMAICIILFPEMKGQMEDVGEVFSSMGAFTAAFGMDRLNFGSLIGFYGVECGNILGLGGGLYASLTATSFLSKEEKDKTAEFLLSQPISRIRIISEKLLALMIEITVMNLLIYLVALGSIAFIGEEIPFKEITLIHLAYYLLQVELASICFGISAFLRKGGLGIGIGLAIMFYFLNIIANIAESVKFLKYLTPFGYCEAADIIESGAIDLKYLAVGIILALIGIALAYLKYPKKDIH